MNKKEVAVFWFRRDLRLEDSPGLYKALTSGYEVLPLFIFDKAILDRLEDTDDRRVSFIHRAIRQLKDKLKSYSSDLLVYYDNPLIAWNKAFEEYAIKAIYTHRDYERYGVERDAKIAALAKENGASFSSFKDVVIFEKNEVVKADGDPYTVFTPYSKRWKKHLEENPIQTIENLPTQNFLSFQTPPIPSLNEMGFVKNESHLPSKEVDDEVLLHYKENRDYPARQGTSRLGVHLRFGTISVRVLAKRALSLDSSTYLNELIWRDFYHQILYHFPHVEETAFRKKYEGIPWRNNEEEFERWCQGQTGFPLVDAGMRQLNETGFMHNRLRMLTAGFLVKDLLIDWRWGEAYFARKLLDFDLAANNGGWQWAAGTGTDAAPYFRVFNPTTQAKKFDPKGRFLDTWVPERNKLSYAKPMVDHAAARKRALAVYKKALDEHRG